MTRATARCSTRASSSRGTRSSTSRRSTFRHAPIAVEMWVTKMGGAGFDIGYDVRDPEDVGDGHYARAETSLVLYDFAQSRPRRIRPDEKAILEGLRGEQVPFRWRGR